MAELNRNIPRQLPDFFQGKRPQNYKKEAVIYHEGDTVTLGLVYGIVRGKVGFIKRDPTSGDIVIVHIQGPGTFFGQEDWSYSDRDPEPIRDTEALALTDCAIVPVVLSGDQLNDTKEGIQRKMILAASMVERASAIDHMNSLHRKGISIHRTAQAILDLADSHGVVEVRQEVIAQRAGAARQTVNGDALPILEGRRLIRREDGEIIVVNSFALLQRASVDRFMWARGDSNPQGRNDQ